MDAPISIVYEPRIVVGRRSGWWIWGAEGDQSVEDGPADADGDKCGKGASCWLDDDRQTGRLRSDALSSPQAGVARFLLVSHLTRSRNRGVAAACTLQDEMRTGVSSVTGLGLVLRWDGPRVESGEAGGKQRGSKTRHGTAGCMRQAAEARLEVRAQR